MATNLPISRLPDSAEGTRLFFDNYGTEPLEYNATEVSATIAFFETQGFDTDAAVVVASTILKQAKIDGTPVFQLLDTLKKLTGIQLGSVVGEVLNNNRTPTSTLGFRTTDVKPNQIRNIAP